MKSSEDALKKLNLPLVDASTPSSSTFEDGAQYRIEIPSTEGPQAFRAVLEEAEKLNCPVHRISQGSGIQMLSDDDIREMAPDRCRSQYRGLSVYHSPCRIRHRWSLECPGRKIYPVAGTRS